MRDHLQMKENTPEINHNMSFHVISPSCQDNLRGNCSYVVPQKCVVYRKSKSKYEPSSERRVHPYFILKKVLRRSSHKIHFNSVCHRSIEIQSINDKHVRYLKSRFFVQKSFAEKINPLDTLSAEQKLVELYTKLVELNTNRMAIQLKFASHGSLVLLDQQQTQESERNKCPIK